MKLQRFSRLLAIIVVLAVVLPAGAASADDPLPVSFFGIQTGDNAAEHEALPLATTAGIGLLRFNLRWAEVEPAKTDPPTYHWAKYDALIGGAAGAGYDLIITVRDNPAWAATTACGPIDKVPLQRYLAFLTALVDRYGGAPYHVRMWELYNEPDNNDMNMPQQGGCWGQHAAAYGQLLAGAKPIVNAAGGQLVLGGVAMDFVESQGGPFNANFMSQLLASPGGTSFDVMNFHYYRAFHYVWDRYGPDVMGKVNFIRDNLLGQQGLSKPIIVTEIGHPSAGPAGDGQNYSDAESSRYVVQAYARGLAAGVESMVWFELLDGPTDPHKYGLLESDATPKPAYTAYSVLTGQLAGHTYLRTESYAGLETYVFQGAGGPKWVAWSKVTTSHNLSVPLGSAWIVSNQGAGRQVSDGLASDCDGVRNGRICVRVGPDPVYVYEAVPADLPARAYLPAIPAGE